MKHQDWECMSDERFVLGIACSGAFAGINKIGPAGGHSPLEELIQSSRGYH